MAERALSARLATLVLGALVATTGVARADETTPGYPERVLHWTTKNKETCDDIASALYGAASQSPPRTLTR
jgi:hypothetical protein